MKKPRPSGWGFKMIFLTGLEWDLVTNGEHEPRVL